MATSPFQSQTHITSTKGDNDTSNYDNDIAITIINRPHKLVCP